MKILQKLLLIMLCLTLTSTVFSQSPYADGAVLRFPNTTIYSNFADSVYDWDSLVQIATGSSGLTTLKEQGTDTLYPDFMRLVLNTDMITRIGNYLIKVDVVNDRGLIISASETNAYSSLVNNNLTATGMMVLDGDEDFGIELLDALEAELTTPSTFEDYLEGEASRCRRADRQTVKAQEEWDLIAQVSCDASPYDHYVMDNKVVYQKFIIYFSLQSKIKSKWRCHYGSLTEPGNWPADVRIIGTVKYKKRCGTEVNKGTDINKNCETELNYRPYQGSRSLSHYDFTSQFFIRHCDATTWIGTYGDYNIKSGY